MKQQHFEYIRHLQQTVWAAAKDMAPGVTLHGSAGPQSISVDPAEFIPMLDTRVQVELAVSDHRREANAELGAQSESVGLYRNQGDDWHFKGVLGTHPPIIEERALAQDIDRLLQHRQDGEPVVALDFGGGFGLSWLRVAAQPRYRRAIEKGQLAMAVTNLGSTPDQSTDNDGYSGVARHMNAVNKLDRDGGCTPSYTPDDLQWTQENQDYVQYLDANALDVGLHSVRLPDGTDLPLAGNVGVIHEDHALMHTHTPDLAIANFRELLAKDGVLASHAATYYHSMHVVPFDEITLESGQLVHINETYSRQRRVALVVGSTMLLQQGYSYRHDDARYLGIFRYEPDKDAVHPPFKYGRILP